MSFNSNLGKDIDRVAKRMLLFPLCYLFNTLFLSIYRLATMDGNQFHASFQGNWRVLTAASCLFALSGFCDALLYGALRGVIPKEIVPGSQPRPRLQHLQSSGGWDSSLGSPLTPASVLSFGAFSSWLFRSAAHV
jgi:hypothetical protein